MKTVKKLARMDMPKRQPKLPGSPGLWVWVVSHTISTTQTQRLVIVRDS